MPKKLKKAHKIKEIDMQIVLPLRIDPSQIIASKFSYFEFFIHQDITIICFLEKIFNFIYSSKLLFSKKQNDSTVCNLPLKIIFDNVLHTAIAYSPI